MDAVSRDQPRGLEQLAGPVVLAEVGRVRLRLEDRNLLTERDGTDRTIDFFSRVLEVCGTSSAAASTRRYSLEPSQRELSNG